MPYHALVPLSAALANLAICLLVLRKGLREPLNRAFALTAAGIVTCSTKPRAKRTLLTFSPRGACQDC